MNLRKIEWKDVDWMNLGQDGNQWWTLCEHGNEPS